MKRARVLRNIEEVSGVLEMEADKTEAVEQQSHSPIRLGAGIFVLSSVVVMFELALTRIFSFSLWSHLAFLVVGTALFGFGLSGVYLALEGKKKAKSSAALPVVGFVLSIIASYLVINAVSFSLWEIAKSPLYLLNTAVWFVALLAPFFFAGIVIARLLSLEMRLSSFLYGADLIGAASGALLFIPVISWFGAEGTVFVCAAFGALAGLVLAGRDQRLRGLLIIFALIFGATSFYANSLFPIKVHQEKREFIKALEGGLVLGTRWSPISRVDLAKNNRPWQRSPYQILAVWIDGGTNHSGILRLPANFSELPPQRWASMGAVHELKQGSSPRVLIIGSSGGTEVFVALSYGASRVDALEMDPSIVKFLKEPEVAEFSGRLFEDPRVRFVNDEGRSYVRRQPEGSYEVIQFINNYTPVAIASGALNVSETFLLTKEAVKDYYSRLSEDGVLAVHRGNALRFAFTALEALRELGVNNPETHLMITNGEWPFYEGFFLKKSPWVEEEEKTIHNFLKRLPREGGTTFLWTPFDRARNNIYSEALSSPVDEQRKLYNSLGANLFPATDDHPFLEHILPIGRSELSNRLPKEFSFRERRKVFGMIPEGDFPYVALLGQAIILALIFVSAPLAIWGRTAIGIRLLGRI